ncbi:PEP-CTERM sorting domain-containing protein [Haloferula chungangensis]|uniref:PEP-CTERM sorting domain-containing protein n=1 Tax=Haloferula chungangensis TaxID=1048331 RepID=A0ABW2L7U2_9BACT
MKKLHLSIASALCLPAFHANAMVLYTHTFDEVANDSTPALQGFSNNVNGVFDLTTGVVGGSGTIATGFNTVSSLDLSAHSEFTVAFYVENNASGVATSGTNGAFFGITSSPNSNNIDGSALYNNAGNTDGPAIGLQVGTGRSAPGGSLSADYSFDMANGNGSFTDLSNAFIDDTTDGYSIFVKYADAGLDTTAVTITSVGLETELNFSTTQAIAYSTFSSAVTPNVSAQGGAIDLSRIEITTIPEPSIMALGSIGLLGLLRRRRVS